ncbi:flagellar filament capping protein FliD [Steroidobacter sp. S1-65]|uniref:Flagellar hook-associated protein 2 n=1 Tax=Steroidobacter gossypii TaxID=2805490 RepID=A0ABS1X510_9GAMM|nr:flagellar filament capping protein FliD [Steroidobacter gossypii]MBM0108314.1 flagellar filament capping protein FliD [Steroidobacter gossypii]
MTGVVGGSSIDVNSLVSQLVAAERKPLDNQLARATQRVSTQISATSALLGALSSFQSALNGLRTTTAFSGRSTTSTNEDIVTATATANAAPGRYDIEVERLASAQQISSVAFPAGATSVVGNGSLTLSLGGSSFTVSIGEPGNTLADVRNAINSATNNPGISASIINAADGAHLVLTSTKTGAANAIQVTQSGTLSQLEYTSTNQANYTQLRAAQDALVHVAGYSATSATNVVTGVIDGVSLNLESAEPGTTVGVEVVYDKAAAKDKIKGFVAAYNSLRGMLTRLGGYDSASKTAGPMLGDAMLSSIDSEIRRTLSSPVAEAGDVYQTLAAIGITTQKDGTLSIDETKLDTALANDFDGVSRLFGNPATGLAARLHEQIGDRLADGAAIDTRNESLLSEQRALQKKKEDIDIRMSMVQQTYLKQFTRLDTLLSSLSATSAYLTQQIDSLPKWSSD